METRRFFILLTTIYAVTLAACSELDRDNPNDPDSSDYKPVTNEQPVQASKPTLTDGMLFDERDGRSYKVVKINDSYWMAENLKYETSSSYCYNDDPINCEKYGKLYPWTVALGISSKYNSERIPYSYYYDYAETSICPEGWVVPYRGDWESLINYAKSDGLKSSFGWKRDYNGKDSYGFSALPGGRRLWDGSYEKETEAAMFWTNAEGDSPSMARSVSINVGYSSYLETDVYKESALSVRCIWGYK
ncbi:MAG: hypothetical protein MJZ26_12640 [Fibrobacter sp.]|nr:hypothetical protein [Fibrobacter sp.]